MAPDRVAKYISENTSVLMLGMGAGPWADAQYLFVEDVLGYNVSHKPHHAKTYRNCAAEFERLQQERIAAFQEFIADVKSDAYPQPEHVVPIKDEEFEFFFETCLLLKLGSMPNLTYPEPKNHERHKHTK